MPRDASGTYTLPIAPFQPLTLAKSADMNAAFTDIADALTDSWSRASPTPAQGDLNLNGHNILNLGQVVGEISSTGNITAGADLHVTNNSYLGGSLTAATITSNGNIFATSDVHAANVYATGTVNAATFFSASGNASI